MTSEMRTDSRCTISHSVSKSHFKCPPDVQLDIDMRQAKVRSWSSSYLRKFNGASSAVKLKWPRVDGANWLQAVGR